MTRSNMGDTRENSILISNIIERGSFKLGQRNNYLVFINIIFIVTPLVINTLLLFIKRKITCV